MTAVRAVPIRLTSCALSAGLLIMPAQAGTRTETEDASRLHADAAKLFLPIATPIAPQDSVSASRIELGRRLFFENRVSMDGNINCAFCHLPEKHGSDGLPKAIGVFGEENPRNAPSVFNAALNFKQHWRGERESLEEQAEKSLLGPASFGNPDFATAIGKLKAIPAYGEAFKDAFPDEAEPINSKNWGRAIAAYERTLLTPSTFDAFLSGDARALADRERAGLRKFIDLGCAGCHNGAGVGGGSFQKFGLQADYWKETGVAVPDRGRVDVTKNDADLYVFKAPALRNVAKTAPYFHDGSVDDLTKAVRVMARTQLGKTLSDTDAVEIVAFLGSLTGRPPANYAAPDPYPDAREQQ
jgi:cytochrome c peroxidase